MYIAEASSVAEVEDCTAADEVADIGNKEP